MNLSVKYLAIVVCMMSLNCTKKNISAQESLNNIPELSLPLSNNKMVIAHCMTHIIRFKDHPYEDGCNPQYYSRYDNSTSSIGGLTQVNVLNEELLKNATMDEAVEFEMLTAKKMGIDGFQFYYPISDNGSDDIIKAYFRVADKKKIDFKFTFCISHPSGSTEDQKIKTFAQRINSIFNEVGHTNEHWLRTPDGRLIMYLWYGEQLADVPVNSTLPSAYYAARAFKKLGEAVNEKFACIYSINENISQNVLNSYLDYFPAVWLWTLPFTENYIGKIVASTCKYRNRTFTGSVFPDFYTSKVLRPGTWDILNATDAVVAGLNNIERKAIVTGLSYNFRKMMEFNIDQDVSIINFITWNDYPEGHHLAPESNHNDGFSILLKYYKNKWLKALSTNEKEQAVVLFKKYPADLKPSPFDIPVVYVENGATTTSGEDGIEVVTILKDNAILIVNSDTVNVTSGMNVTKFKEQPGYVYVTVQRQQNNVIEFTTPEKITYTPFRTDRLTYTYSNETAELYKELFGH